LAIASLMCWVPINIPGGNPPIEVPGLSPRSPVILVAPVLVIDEPARTAKLAAPANTTVACTVVCKGITIGVDVVEEGARFLSFLHPVIIPTDTIARAVSSCFVFIVCCLGVSLIAVNRGKDEDLNCRKYYISLRISYIIHLSSLGRRRFERKLENEKLVIPL